MNERSNFEKEEKRAKQKRKYLGYETMTMEGWARGMLGGKWNKVLGIVMGELEGTAWMNNVVRTSRLDFLHGGIGISL